jgi:hypothetical protein
MKRLRIHVFGQSAAIEELNRSTCCEPQAAAAGSPAGSACCSPAERG